MISLLIIAKSAKATKNTAIVTKIVEKQWWEQGAVQMYNVLES
jgi:hypothetical protein